MQLEQKKVTQHSERYERIKKCTENKWHLHHKKSLTYQLWNYIYDQLVENFESDGFPDRSKLASRIDSPWFEIIFYSNNHATVITNKKYARVFKGFVFEKAEDYDQVVKDLNEVLIKYELVLRKPTKSSYSDIPRCISEQHYFVNFVNE